MSFLRWESFHGEKAFVLYLWQMVRVWIFDLSHVFAKERQQNLPKQP